MSQTNEAEDAIKSKHKELCSQLNMDPEAMAQSWKNFDEVRKNHTLDGEPIHWLSCALYVACRKPVIPTVGLSGAAVEGNCVSLTMLLRLCSISLAQFFNNIRKWIEMTCMSEEFLSKVIKLERNFTVSSVLFSKFEPMFLEMFLPFENVEPTKHTKGNKKIKMMPCTVNSLFEFCWCLFVCAKGEFPLRSDDLVTMFHLLLACLDLVYGNAIMDKRKDLVNPNFEGLPSDWSSPNYEPPQEPPCIMETLCNKYQGIYVEAMDVKLYAWNIVIKNFFSKSLVKGDDKNLTGVLQMPNFDFNLKSLNKMYETYILSVGEFDERIFLSQKNMTRKVGDDSKPSCALSYPTHNISSLVDGTPLTGRKHLKLKSDVHMTPVTSTTHSVQRLHSYLKGHGAHPSENLQALFRNCKENPMDAVIAHQQKMGAQFIEAYTPLNLESIVYNRLNLIVTLYFRLLEHIIKEETRKKPTIDLQALMGQRVFLQTLFICCVEIVMHAYMTQAARFPWVLETFQVAPFSFYKIIELVVLGIKEKLTRDTVKHLNFIEEQVLESLIWTSKSPLWEIINNLEEPIPSWSDVKPVETPMTANSNNVIAGVTPTNPTANNNLQMSTQSIRRLNVTNQAAIPQSPVSSAMDRFVTPSSDLARQLFQEPNTIRPGQSLLNHNNQASISSTPSVRAVSTAPNRRTSKISSLGLFFRKFYSMAVVRLKDLCKNLKLYDEELIQKIWTCFEYSVISQSHLMKDRHVDQMLMCSIYITCKVLKNDSISVDRSFTDIMKCYRQQPQATPQVYRSVLISYENSVAEGNNENTEATAPNTPSCTGNTTVQIARQGVPVRNDLINFYNTVYVKCLQSYALRFTSRSEPTPLSPLPPHDRSNVCKQGPWKVSEDHNVYVRPLTASSSHISTSATIRTYKFSRSPSKDLENINSFVGQEIFLKRKTQDGEESTSLGGPTDSKVPCMAVRILNSFKTDQ